MPPAMNPQDQELIAAASAQKLGPVPGAPAPQPQAPAPAPMPVTPSEAANAALSPNTEGDKSQQEAIEMLKVNFGENDTRHLTESQIAGTFKRYGDLNKKHADNKPILDFASQIQEGMKAQGMEANPSQIVDFLTAASAAFSKNPVTDGSDNTFNEGGQPNRQNIPIDIQKGAQQQALTDDFVDSLTKWEDQNGVSLPPGYKDAATNMESLKSQNAKLMQAVEQLMSGQQKTGDLAQQQLQQADQANIGAFQQMAANNLNKAQATHGLPDEMEEPFMEFAYQRGYTMEDFVDPQLTNSVVGDFKAASQGGELERLQDMAKRRQAYTGTIDGTPSSGGPSAAPSPDAAMFDGMVDSELNRRSKYNIK